VLKLIDTAEDVVRPVMDAECVKDRLAVIMGYAGVYSSFLKHAYRAADRYGSAAPTSSSNAAASTWWAAGRSDDPDRRDAGRGPGMTDTTSATETAEVSETADVNDDIIDRCADTLDAAVRDRVAIPRLTLAHPELSVELAYLVQEERTRRRVAAGDPVIGAKLGLTARAKQVQMKVAEPVYGALFAGDLHPAKNRCHGNIDSSAGGARDRLFDGRGVTRPGYPCRRRAGRHQSGLLRHGSHRLALRRLLLHRGGCGG